MPAAFIATWVGAGILAGTLLVIVCPLFVTSAPIIPGAVRLVVVLLTGLLFGVLAGRFGDQFDLLPYSVLATLGTVLGLVDIIEQRLPSLLVYSGAVVVGALLAASAIGDSREHDFCRALAGMGVVTTFYLVLAMASGGGLGAGDVKLGGLLGLALGWLSWSVLLAATFLGWFMAALASLLLRAARSKRRGSVLPMGPFLLSGALLAIVFIPA